jgi:hypothetical protein
VKDGYDEPVTIPKAARELVEGTVAEAVKQDKLWLTSGQASILAEEIPAGLLTDDARLHQPPQPIPAADVTRPNLPEVWAGETTTALAIAVALSKKAGMNLPWATVRNALDRFHSHRDTKQISEGGRDIVRGHTLRTLQLYDSVALPRLLEQFRSHAPDIGCSRHRHWLVKRLQKARNHSPLARRRYVPAGILHEPSWPKEGNGNRQLAERPLHDRVLAK